MSLERLGRELAREQDALREAPTSANERAQVRERLAAWRPPLQARPDARSARRRWAGAALTAALAAAAVVALWPRVSRDERVPGAPAALAAVLERSQQAVAAGAFVEAPASAALALRFSDGTRLRLSAGARARLVALDANGAHVLLESGQLHVEVVPKAHARWRMSAGPFVVRVTGTRFDLSWAPEQDRFELDLASGQVEVGGCVFGRGYRMRAGQRIHASCKRGQFEVAEQRAAGETGEHGQGAEPASAPAANAQAATAVPAAPIDAPAAKTRRSEVVARPRPAPEPAPERDEQAEFEQRCARASGEQLVQLAEAARFAGEIEREELAWRLLRRRFAGTSRAALAAFSLGRLAFDVRGEHRKAAEWFGTYLKEQPAGLLAREARGRLIEATLAAGDATRARALAQAYLREHPDGPHADLARRAAREP